MTTLKGSQKWRDIMKDFVENIALGTVPSEEKFRIRIRSVQEDAWMEHSTKKRGQD